ncbi:hypothetical protein D1007_05087 [Hordeum vulgare]|nr:hypothetical protein D1007_05087 [Hordeum vulgare]
MALPGGPTTPTPEQPEPLRLAEEEVREAELFEDAVDVSPTASAHPVTWREGEAAPSSSPSMSVSIPPRSEAGAADDEEEAYESPPASGASGPPGIDSAGWSPSVSESREGSASPSGSARGARRRRRGIGGPCRGQQARQGWRTQVIEDAFAKKKAWEFNVACSEVVDLSKIQYHGPIPTMEP